jgi:hypothetical protein
MGFIGSSTTVLFPSHRIGRLGNICKNIYETMEKIVNTGEGPKR